MVSEVALARSPLTRRWSFRGGNWYVLPHLCSSFFVIILSSFPARLVETSLLVFLGSGTRRYFPSFFSLDCLHTSTTTLGSPGLLLLPYPLSTRPRAPSLSFHGIFLSSFLLFHIPTVSCHLCTPRRRPFPFKIHVLLGTPTP